MTKICLDNLRLPLEMYDRARIAGNRRGYRVSVITKGLGIQEDVAYGLTREAALDAAFELNRLLIANRKLTT